MRCYRHKDFHYSLNLRVSGYDSNHEMHEQHGILELPFRYPL